MISRSRSRDNPCQKALSLRTSGVVYFRQIGKANSAYEVIDALTGEVTTLTPRQFNALYVPTWDLPPHQRSKADAAPSWREWQAVHALDRGAYSAGGG